MQIHAPNNQQNQNLTTAGMTPLASTAKQANLFTTQLQTEKTNKVLQSVANDSGLATLASDDSIDNWHSVMGETYGYNPNDTEGEQYQNSEDIRTIIRDANWPQLGVNIDQVNEGDLGADAAFIGGDTSSVADDAIVINKAPSNNLNTAITEELFHLFERKINSARDGDTRLVNGVASFEQGDIGADLDEGALGRALLSQSQSGEKIDAKKAVNDHGGEILDNDTANISLNGNEVQAEFIIPRGAETPARLLGEELAIKDAAEINDFIKSTGYAAVAKMDGYEDIVGVFSHLSSIAGREQLFASELQNLAAWMMDNDPATETQMSEWLDQEALIASDNPAVPKESTRGAAVLEGSTYDSLNGDIAGYSMNADVWKHMSGTDLLNLRDNLSMSSGVQNTIGAKMNDGDEGASEVLGAFHDIGAAAFDARYTAAELSNKHAELAPYADIYSDENTPSGTGRRLDEDLDFFGHPGTTNPNNNYDPADPNTELYNLPVVWDPYARNGAQHTRERHANNALNDNLLATRFYLEEGDELDGDTADHMWATYLAYIYADGIYINNGETNDGYYVNVRVPNDTGTIDVGLPLNDDGLQIHPVNGRGVTPANPLQGLGYNPQTGAWLNTVRYIFNEHGHLITAYPITDQQAGPQQTLPDGDDPFDPAAVPAANAPAAEVAAYQVEGAAYEARVETAEAELKKADETENWGYGLAAIFGSLLGMSVAQKEHLA